jgi:hypothetical protein
LFSIWLSSLIFQALPDMVVVFVQLPVEIESAQSPPSEPSAFYLAQWSIMTSIQIP